MIHRIKASIINILFSFFILLVLVSYCYAEISKNRSHFDCFLVPSESHIKHANFADHYLIKTYGCGGGAICGEIKNLLTNQVIGLPNAYLIEDENGQNEFSIDYRLNSSLVIISGIVADPIEDEKGYAKRYYHFVDDKLQLISLATFTYRCE